MIFRRPPTPAETMSATWGLLTVVLALLAWQIGSPMLAGLVLIVLTMVRFRDRDDDDDDFDEDCFS